MIIAIEGNDQAGKATQAKLLNDFFSDRKIRTARFSFPDYDTATGKVLKELLNKGILKSQRRKIYDLMALNRLEKHAKLVNCSRRSVVIIDRYTPSNLVYGMADGFDIKWLEKIDQNVPAPKMVIVLDISPKTSFKRKKRNRDIFENNATNCAKVSQVYRGLAKWYGWTVVNGEGTKEEVHERVKDAILIKFI